MTSGPVPNPIEDALTRAGYPPGEANILGQVFGAEPVAEFMAGLADIAQAIADQVKPKLVPSAAEPWRTIHGHMMANGAQPEHAYEVALKLWPAPVQMAVDAVVSLKLADVMSQKQAGQAPRQRKFKTAEYIAALRSLGYTFRMNDVNDTLEVNSKPITDAVAAEIRARMRDLGFDHVNVMEDAYLAEAHHNRYHPVKEYLDSLKWDGSPHIHVLASHFSDKYGVFETWLRHWLVGAVAKVLGGKQNVVLVLDGPQGLGKSLFVQWLGRALPEYFTEAAISLDDKDTYLRLISTWIWEVAEFGQTMRKFDREALKNFITLNMVTVRRPYGRYDITKPAMASMIGTVNNEIGILDDPTGSRRYLVTHVDRIDWNYTKLDVRQVWAEAHALYLAGHDWQLKPEDRALAAEINEAYEVEDPVEGLLLKLFKVEPKNPLLWTSSQEILATLETNGLKGASKQNSMALAQTMKRLGCLRKKQPNSQGQRVWGYMGVIVI
jgi:hypothetical protein